MSIAVQSATSISDACRDAGEVRSYRDPVTGRDLGLLTPVQAPEGAIPLPEPGEVVRIDDAAMGQWVGLAEPVVGPQITVRLLNKGEVSAHLVAIPDLCAGKIVVGQQDEATTLAVRALSQAYAVSDRAHIRNEWWKESLVEDAHDYANAHDLCSRFDEFMVEHDLPARSYEHIVEVELTVTLSIEGYDDNHVEGQVDRERVIDKLNDPCALESLSFRVRSIERD
jgi:hypothetical protein